MTFTSRKSILLVRNPTAGRRRRGLVDEVVRLVRDAGWSVDLVDTAGAGDARRLAETCDAERYPVIAVAGGDGTINEVVNGLAARPVEGPTPVLAIVPLGTANVLAHELGHVKHRDTLTMTVAATLAGAIGMLANFAFFFGGSRDENGRPQNPIVGIAMMILAPLAASLVQMAISRSREYEADRAGAEISGNPLWLASALQRLHEGAQAIPNATAEANPATAHLYIDNPLSGGGMRSLFSTHPPMEERIARLQAMAHEPGGGGHWAAPQAAPAPVRRGGSVPQTGSRGPWS